jgi:hypothetical protein
MGRREFYRFTDLFGLVENVRSLRSRWIEAYRSDTPFPQFIDRREPGWLLPAFSLFFDRASSLYARRNNGDAYGPDTPPNLLNRVFTDAPRGSWIHCYGGDYPMGIASPAVTFNMGGFKFSGEGSSGRNDGLAKPATRFMAGANNQTLFQGSPTKTTLFQDWQIGDFACIPNGFTGGVGVDMTMTENSTGGAIVRNLCCSAFNQAGAYPSGSFAQGLILDGCEDVTVDNFRADGGSSSTAGDIQWNVVSGNIKVKNSFIGSALSLIGKFQTALLENCTLVGIQYNGAGSSGVNILTARDSYFNATAANTSHKIDVNGQVALQIALYGCFLGTYGKNIVNVGVGTVDTFIAENCYMKILGGAVAFSDTPASVGRRRLHVRGMKSDAGVTGLPTGVSIDVNGYWTPDS